MIISVENMIARRRVGDKGAVDMLKAAGFNGIDYSLCSMDDWYETVDSPVALDFAAELREYANERGMAFTQSHAPFRFKFGMQMCEKTEEYRQIVRSMEFAARLGAPMIVIHAVLCPEGCDRFEYNLRYYRSFLEYAHRFGIKIGVENLLGRETPESPATTNCLGSPETFCAMQDELSDPMICGCLDLGHALITTGDPAGFIRKSRGHVHYLHIHDNNGDADLHQLPALYEPAGGRYKMPWKEVCAALSDIGFDGPINLELLRYMNNFRTEELPLALELAAATGKALGEIILKGGDPQQKG